VKGSRAWRGTLVNDSMVETRFLLDLQSLALEMHIPKTRTTRLD